MKYKIWQANVGGESHLVEDRDGDPHLFASFDAAYDWIESVWPVGRDAVIEAAGMAEWVRSDVVGSPPDPRFAAYIIEEDGHKFVLGIVAVDI